MGTYCECGNKRFSELHGDMVDDEWVCECCQLTAKKDQRIAELEADLKIASDKAYNAYKEREKEWLDRLKERYEHIKERDNKIKELQAVVAVQMTSFDPFRRIAELEEEQVTLAKDAYHRGLQDGRDVPDDLLEWLLSKAHYSGAWGDKYDKAEAILAKRKEEQ